MNGLCAMLLALLLPIRVANAQTPISHGKPTEKVIIEYERLVEKGAFLTPEGWKAAGKLYKQVVAFSPTGEVSLMGTGGAVGEDWMRDGTAEVETKWTDYYGAIDSALRYTAPHTEVPVTMIGYVFRLIYTNNRIETDKHGAVIREVDGPWEWKIEAPQMSRWTTVSRAIEYVTMMRDRTDDPVLKKNAAKTIAALKRLTKPCGNASAC
jgi:hypothetical protein